VPAEQSRTTVTGAENARGVFDLIVIGAGAAGLATAIFTARAAPSLRVSCLDGARTIGAKILVSGGSRCNVTNRVVTEHDFWGGSRHVIRRVLRAFPADRAAAFFEQIGVALHEEEDGKLFPDSHRSRTVLEALLREADRLGIGVGTLQRVRDLRFDGEWTALTTANRVFTGRAVAIATGGRSLPKTGSDGFGYQLAARLGHGHVVTTPALAPLLVSADPSISGVSHSASMVLRRNGRPPLRLEGAMLWTHFGVSGPLALNMSRHWERAHLAGENPSLLLNVMPGETFESVEAWFLDQQQLRPRAQVSTVVGTRVPAAIAAVWCTAAGVRNDTTMAHVSRDARRQLIHTLVETSLPVTGSRGYSYAEATAGGVPLEEIDPATMQSRIRPRLYFAGEILDVDGRLGGFNFQWSWSSAYVAGQDIARTLTGAGSAAGD
jgi:predicted Rossmann fold flavoprotein